jgi:hypothetical protein
MDVWAFVEGPLLSIIPLLEVICVGEESAPFVVVLYSQVAQALRFLSTDILWYWICSPWCSIINLKVAS